MLCRINRIQFKTQMFARRRWSFIVRRTKKSMRTKYRSQKQRINSPCESFSNKTFCCLTFEMTKCLCFQKYFISKKSRKPLHNEMFRYIFYFQIFILFLIYILSHRCLSDELNCSYMLRMTKYVVVVSFGWRKYFMQNFSDYNLFYF